MSGSSSIPTLTITPSGVSPSAAADAYGRVASGADDAPSAGATGFGSALQRAIQGAVATSEQADTLATQAISGKPADLTEVVTAVARAQLALQTTITIRDRVVHAYQDIMRMSI
jgi:flagellar hook-basal body complex protein FliE